MTWVISVAQGKAREARTSLPCAKSAQMKSEETLRLRARESRAPAAAPALKQAGTKQRSRQDACADHVTSAGASFTLLQNPLSIRLHDQGRGALARSALGGRERVGPVVVIVAANNARLLSPGHRAHCPIGYSVSIEPPNRRPGQLSHSCRRSCPPAQRSLAHWA